MPRWTVQMTPSARLEFKRMAASGQLSKEDFKALYRWLSEMEEFGPSYIAQSSDWHDHELEREWRGFRASAFSSKGRIVYRVIGSRVIVEVYKVTTIHDYRE